MRTRKSGILLCLLSIVTFAQVCAQQKTVPKPADCGTTRSCFSDCQGSLCGFVVSWTTSGSTVVYTISSSLSSANATWMAIGFSNDKKMDSDDVIGCASNGIGSAVKFSGNNGPHSRPTLYADTELTLTSYGFQNGINTCSLQRPTGASTNGRVDVNTAWTLLFATGSTTFTATGEPTISFHGTTNRYWSTVPVTATGINDAGAANTETVSTATSTNTGTATTASTTGTISKASGCGSTMGCLSDCKGTTCGFIATWVAQGNNAIYTFSTNLVGTSGTWIAIGFSSDTLMGKDDLLGCAADASGRVVAFTAKNNKYSSPNYYSDAEVTLTSGKVENNVLSCTIQRPIAGASNGRSDVSQSWTLLIARGDATVSQTGQASISKHAYDNRFWSSVPVTVNDNKDIAAVNTETTVAPAPAPAPAPVTGTVLKASGCGSSIGCLSDCQGTTCGFIVTWVPSGNDSTYTFSTNLVGTTGTWIAVAFSDDSKMGEDDILGCASDASGNVVRFTALNNAYSPPTYYTDTAVVLLSGKVEDNVLSCTIRRPVAAAANGRRDVSQAWTLLVAKGVATIASGQAAIQKHLSSHRYISSQQVKVTDMVDLGASSSQSLLIKAHGSLMIAAWIFLASIGIVLARYYKPVWSGLMCSEKVWFQLHRICMILVFCATTAGFVIIFVEINGYSEINEEREFLVGHPIIGIIVMILTVINPVMALFRPHPGTPRRPIFNWGHWFVGTAAHILAVVNVFFGVLLSKSNVPYYLVYILGAYVAWQVFIELVLELLSFLGNKIERSDAYEMNSDGDAKKPTAVESSNTILIKRIILIVHCVIVACFSAALIGLLNTGKEELEKR